jgi:hypothetical protein
MRELRVSDLPPAHETGRCDMVVAKIRLHLTQARHKLKHFVSQHELRGACLLTCEMWDKLEETDDLNAEDLYIANFTRRCIGNMKHARPTVGLYMRIAFLVRHSVSQASTWDSPSAV